MVTADGAAEGVPSVVSDAINWAPESWKAEIDDVFAATRVGIGLLFDDRAALDGLNALRVHNKQGVASWLRYLVGHLHTIPEEIAP